MTGGKARRLGAGGALLACLLVLVASAASAPPAFTVANVTVAESADATFTVTLAEPAPAGGVALTFSTANGSATAPDDFTAQTDAAVPVIPEGQTSATFDVPVAQDALDEDAERFTVTVRHAEGGDQTATATITDDDAQPETTSISDVTVDEAGGTADFTIQLSASSGKEIQVRYSTNDGSATAPGDYTSQINQPIIFAPGQTQKTISIAVVNDSTPEGSEWFFVNLLSGTDVTIAGDTQGQATITDNDVAPTVTSVGDATVTEGNSGEVTAGFRVQFDRVASGLVVRYSTAPGTASSPSDYDAVANAPITVPAGQDFVDLLVQVNGDTLPEGSGSPRQEDFSVIVNSVAGGTLGSDVSGRGQINDDDAPPTVDSISSATVTEGNSGVVSANFIVKLSGIAPSAVTVRYSTRNGSATAPADYVAETAQDLTIAAGKDEGTISVDVKGDTLAEGSGSPRLEDFFVDLLSATGATLAPGKTGTGTITDDDELPTISIVGAEVTEGSGGTVNLDFKVKLSATSAQRVEVTALTQNETALSTSDYQFKSLPIVWAPNTPADELEKIFRVVVNGDTLDEKAETLIAKLESPQNATLSATSQAVGKIIDNDNTSLLSASDAEANEGIGGTTSTITFKITLLPASDRPVTVNYATANGTALAGSDYTAAEGQVAFAEGQTEKTVVVTILGDDVNEENETILLNLSGASGGGMASGGAQGQGTIVDKNAPPSLSISDTTAREGTGATFTVTLAGTTLREVRVGFDTNDGTAKAGSDYSARTGSLSFAPGEKSKTISVTVLDDTATEPLEEFSVTIGDAVNAVITKSRGVASIEASDQVAGAPPAPTTTPPTARPASVLVPRMILGPRTVSVGANGIARMLVTCQKVSPISCSGTVELERAGKPVLKLGKKTFTVKKGAKGYASIKLTPRSLTLLRKSGTMRAKVTVLVKTSTKTLKVSPGTITLKSVKTKAPPPRTKVIVDP